MIHVTSVQHRTGWCALKGKLDPDAISDATMCGHFVTMRIGSAERAPDCPECLVALKIRRKRKKNV